MFEDIELEFVPRLQRFEAHSPHEEETGFSSAEMQHSIDALFGLDWARNGGLEAVRLPHSSWVSGGTGSAIPTQARAPAGFSCKVAKLPDRPPPLLPPQGWELPLHSRPSNGSSLGLLGARSRSVGATDLEDLSTRLRQLQLQLPPRPQGASGGRPSQPSALARGGWQLLTAPIVAPSSSAAAGTSGGSRAAAADPPSSFFEGEVMQPLLRKTSARGGGPSGRKTNSASRRTKSVPAEKRPSSEKVSAPAKSKSRSSNSASTSSKTSAGASSAASAKVRKKAASGPIKLALPFSYPSDDPRMNHVDCAERQSQDPPVTALIFAD
mmetsp:Transcript_50245/g.106757  ORF Transcript_50245/g.106757 Transcript_50245/m.106757 type:complete len:324 (-) Transcript_50245:114-1085(-)